MTFVSLGFLTAMLAAAIPVILHMISRQRAKDMPFSTLRFLRISAQKTRRRRRVHDVLLMLLRMAVLILIAIGLAEPTLTNLSSFWGGGISAVAIVLDNSASMGTLDTGCPRFDTARRAAHQIMGEIQAGDQVALLMTGGPEFPEQDRLQRSHERVLEMLDRAEVSYERADLALRVQEARELLAKSDARNKQIYVISDMQELSWEGLLSPKKGTGPISPQGPKGASQKLDLSPFSDPFSDQTAEADELQRIPVIIVDCNRAPKPNVAVSGLNLDTAVPVAGVKTRATVELFNASEIVQERHLELHLDGSRQAGTTALAIPPQGRIKHDFEFKFTRGGVHRGEVRLVGDDGSQLDDRRFFAFQIERAIPVAVVKPQRHEIACLEDSFYVEQALAPAASGGWAVRTTILTSDELISEPLGNYTAIFCVNLSAPDADAAARLRDYVTGGGNLIWICGDNVEPEAYNRMNESASRQLLPAALLDVRAPAVGEDRDSWTIGMLDKTHRALVHLAEPASLYRSVLVYRHVRLDAASSPAAQVMARLDDGEPLLMQQRIEQGTVTMLGTSAHVGWTNLPLRPIFLPLLARLTFDLAGAEQSRRQMLAGSPLVLELDDGTRSVGVEVLTPSGATIRLSSEGQPDGSGQTFTYADTHDVGIYVLRPLDSADRKQIAYAVNMDPDESAPKKITREELEGLFVQTPLIFADDPDDLTATFAKLREGESLWEAFLAAVLIALVFETFVANRLSWKREDDALQKVEPGMRRLARKGQSAA